MWPSVRIAGAPAITEDPEHRHQQQIPLRITHHSPVAAIGDGFEEADQVGISAEINERETSFGHLEGARPAR